MVVVLAMSARSARADPADDEVAHGEELGRQGSWTQAIDHFKAADRIAPRAKHACLIGLAYARRELWAEAELFLALCHQRATPSDPTPDWLPDAETQLGEKLAASSAPAVTLRIDPPEATPTITISSFAPGETLTPRVIHLAPGNHVMTVTAPGYDPVKQEIAVVAGTPRDVHITLHRITPHSRVPLVLFGISGALAVGALVYDLTAVRNASNALDTPYQYAYDAARAHYERTRTNELIILGGAAVTAAAGVVLRLVLDRPSPVRIQAEARSGGAGVMVEWSR